jgi:hypothetical protein
MGFAQAPAAAQPNNPDAGFKTIDALFSQTKLAVSQFEEFLNSAVPALKAAREAGSGDLTSEAKKNLQEKCSADFSIDFILSNKSSASLGKIAKDLWHYYECEAFSQRKVALCKAAAVSPLTGFYKSAAPSRLESDCQAEYIYHSLIQLNVSNRPDALKACETLPFPSDFLDPGDTQKGECLQLLSKEPEAGCKNPVSPDLGKEGIENCLTHRILHGDESVCPLIKDAPLPEDSRAALQERCRDAAAYRKAYQTKDAGRCLDSLACRMMMGEKICGRHLDRAQRIFCPIWTQEKLKDAVVILTAERQAVQKNSSNVMGMLKQRREQVDDFFTQLSALMNGFEPKSEPGYVTRKEAFKTLSNKFNQSLKKASPRPPQAPLPPSRRTPGS